RLSSMPYHVDGICFARRQVDCALGQWLYARSGLRFKHANPALPGERIEIPERIAVRKIGIVWADAVDQALVEPDIQAFGAWRCIQKCQPRYLDLRGVASFEARAERKYTRNHKEENCFELIYVFHCSCFCLPNFISPPPPSPRRKSARGLAPCESSS